MSLITFCKRLPLRGRLPKTAWRVVRITAAILLICSLHVTAKSVSQTITLQGKNIPLTTVFAEIEKQSGYLVVTSKQLIADAKPVSVDVRNYPLLQFLDETLSTNGLGYTIENKTIFLKKKIETEPAVKNLLPISGIVKGVDGKPLANVNVVVKGTDKGTTTNNEGRFSIEAKVGDILVFSRIGYHSQQAKVNSVEITIALQIFQTPLEEVVVNKGYYTEQQKITTGNVSVVSAKDIERQPVSNPLQAVQGRVPGLTISQLSGVAGGSFNVQIRGRSSLDGRVSNDPLYIIDGVPYTSSLVYSLGFTIFGQSSNGTIGNPFNYLNPADIASIAVLKDADATAIYGSRGANGVVLITTKRGKPGKTKFQVDFYSGIGKVNRNLEMLDTKQYLLMRHEAFVNDNAQPQPWDYDVNGQWDTTINQDWQKTLIGGTARYTNVQGTMSGGNDFFQYLIGGTYRRETTAFPGEYADRRGGVNININNVSSNKKFGFNASAIYLSDYNNLPIQDVTSFINLPPNSPQIYNVDGTLNWANSTWQNPYSYLLTRGKFRTKNLVSNIRVNYQFTDNINVETSVGYTNMQNDQVSSTPMEFYAPAYRQFNTRSASFVNNSIESWIVEPKITYRRQLGKGTLSLLAGATINQSFSSGQVLNAEGFNSDLVLENIQAATIVKPGVATDDEYRYAAGFGRVNYNINDTYIFNLTGRRDGSSRFGPERQFHNFGAIGVAWVFSNERFLQRNIAFISHGKLRASYGTTGNDQVGNYRFMDLYRNTTSPYQGASGLTTDNLFNPELAWELNRKLEFGLDVGFLKDRVNFSAAWYNNRSSNQLVNLALPALTGFASIDANLPATVQNTGVEMSFTSVNINSVKFRWVTSVNVTIPRNKLISFPGLESSPYANTYVIGKPITIVKVFEMAGVDQETGQYQFFDSLGKKTFVPAIGSDANKAVNISPRVYGGVQNTISFNGIQFDFLLQFVRQTGPNYLYDFVPGSYGVNQPSTVMERWRSPGDLAAIQRFNQDYSLQTAYQNAKLSDQAYSDASFIRLKNVNLLYELPEKLVNEVGFNNASVYIQAQNLSTITNYKGMDPESQSTKNIPPLRVITLGIRVSL